MKLSEKAQAPTLDSGRSSPDPDLNCNSRTNHHKVLVRLGGGGLRCNSSRPLAVDHLPQAVEGGCRIRENFNR